MSTIVSMTMGWERVAQGVLAGALSVALISLLVGAILGQPVLLSFVETGSMEPTLEPGDGFVAIPTPLAGEIQEGDVVVFEAQRLQGGDLTTHRVVGETDRGYVTKGDANPFTDQDGQEPPVTDAQVVAVALQVNGGVLAIPGLGTYVWSVQGAIDSVQRTLAITFGTRAFLGTQGLAILLAAVGLAVLAAGGLFDNDRRRRLRERARERECVYHPPRLILAMALFIALVSTGTMVVMSDTHEYGLLSASFESENPTTVQVGEEAEVRYRAYNGGQLPVYAFYSPASSNVVVDDEAVRMSRGEEHIVTVVLQAPTETGYYPQHVSEYRYFAVLPFGVVAWLHSIHPWLPLVTTAGTMGGMFLVAGVALVGTSPVRTRSQSRGSWLRAR